MQRYRANSTDDKGEFVLWSDVQDLIEQHKREIKLLSDSWKIRYGKLKNSLYANLYKEKKNDEFRECAACAAKPGMPRLCDGRVEGRALIAELKKRRRN